MSFDSDILSKRIHEFLQTIDIDKKMLTFGFVKKYSLTLSIIDYIIVYTFLFWDSWGKGGDNIKINGAMAIREKDNNGAETIYGYHFVENGQHEWKIKILKLSQWIVIGIATTTDHSNTYFHYYNDPNYYSYINSGKIESRNIAPSEYPSGNNKVTYNVGDIITIHLDLDYSTIGFSKNNKYIGKAFEITPCFNKKDKGFRLSVSMNQLTKIKMISYKHDDELIFINTCKQCKKTKNGRIDYNYKDGTFYCIQCWGAYSYNTKNKNICRQCGKSKKGKYDNQNGLFYCHSCWNSYTK